MNGIDISSWQAGIRPSQVESDFVIIKATEGTNYINPYWREWADEVLDSGKLLGLYHYADGLDVVSEADFFLDEVRDYIGKALLVLDWESGGNYSFGSHDGWTTPWLNYVMDETGSMPMLYLSASIAHANSWPHKWIAQYPDYTPTYYQDHPWNEGAYECDIRQYSSVGRIPGYGGNLDINKAYITEDEWWALVGKEDFMANAQDIIDILKDTSDPTGRGMNLTDHDHIKWIAAVCKDISAKLDELQKKIDALEAK